MLPSYLKASLILWFLFSNLGYAQDFKILVFTKTEGYTHSSISEGVDMLEQLGAQNNFEVDPTADASLFTEENLAQYAAVVFLSTTGDVLNDNQQNAFERYIRQGGGFVGIHAASDTEYNWPWYGDLIGAYFSDHPPGTPRADIKVSDHVHPSTQHLPASWTRTDEWYNFAKNPRGDVHVLATLDETSYSGGTMGYDHPIIWCHEFDGGRSWYTAGGHTADSFSEPLFANHVLGGILYAANQIEGNFDATLDRNFEISVIDNSPSNPLGLTVLPDNRLLYIERSGTVKLYDPRIGTITQAASFDVDSNREDGLLGITIDPDFESNNWLYLFYSPAGDAAVQHVSRFTFSGTTIDRSSEKILMVIPVQREQCCHSGGDLEFDTHGNLYISLGDNVNPFSSDGYTPIDERTAYLDAQGTSANTKDYRGKILRITPKDDGTYSIPEGNLFTDSNKGYPEIYTMGHRNPFRFTVGPDDYLYVGEVGPDSNANSSNRGPRGYDEFNRTKEATNFGWPYCIANNLSYVDYDFETGASGANFDCDNPTNTSIHNTGATNLPPASPAWIWYHDGVTDDFPAMGTGAGRTAMAGAVYEYDSGSSSEVKFPAYYDRSIFIYEWARNWIREIKVDDQGNIVSINPFLDSLDWNRPIDMDFGPDGAMYIVEWGTGFRGNNEDSRIIKVSFKSGNRTPIAIAKSDAVAGKLPLTINFDAEDSYDTDAGDVLSYEWDFDGDGIFDASGSTTSYTYTQEGVFSVQLKVTDNNGASAFANLIITAGNSAPEVTIENPVNGGFFAWGETIDFEISVIDEEDGSTENGTIDCANVSALASIGHDDHSHDLNANENCQGNFITQAHGDEADNVFYLLRGYYSDEGSEGTGTITGTDTHLLQPKLKEAEHYTSENGTEQEGSSDPLGGGNSVGFINDGDYISFDPINLQGIEHLTFRASSDTGGGYIEVHTDSVDGPLLGSRFISGTGDWNRWDYFTMPIQDPGGTHELFLVFKGESGFLFNLNWIEFHGQGVATKDSNALKGLEASYYNNVDFEGTPILTKDPLIAFNWEENAPLPGINSDGFSVRWEGNLEVDQTGDYSLFTDHSGGSVKITVDGVVVTDQSSDGQNTTATLSLTQGQNHAIVITYVHTAGPAAIKLGWGQYETIYQSNFNIGDDGTIDEDCENKSAFALLQAENFCQQSGVEKTNMGSAIGYINDGDWVMYPIDFGDGGPQKVSASVASARNGGYIEFRHHGVDGDLIGTIAVRNTGDWTTFETFMANTTEITGIHPVYMVFRGDPGNLFDVDWFQFSSGGLSEFSRIEAENFDGMRGIEVEQATEGGDSVSYIEDSDWILFEDLDLTDVENLNFRVSSNESGGNIEIRIGSPSGTLIGEAYVANTGGWQNWQTVSAALDQTDGIQDLYLVFTGGSGFLFNVNWFEISRTLTNTQDFLNQKNIMFFPNPISDSSILEGAANANIKIYDLRGNVVLSKNNIGQQEKIDLQHMATGIYFIRIVGAKDISVIKVKKQ